MVIRWLAIFALATYAACTLLDDDPPKNTCKVDTDCFRAQGEVCSPQTHTCVTRSDAGVDAP